MFSFQAFSQNDYKPKLGQIDRQSLEMTAYEKDSTADAVVLYDYGEVRFIYDSNLGIVLEMECWARIKILKESALDRASVSLPFRDGGEFKLDERIDGLVAYTHNLENGQIVTTKMDRKSVKTEKLSDKYKAYKFNLPNVKKGSVIEYSYTRSTPFNLRDKPDGWSFQGSVPFKWSEYRIKIPYFLDYKMAMKGYLSLDVNERQQENLTLGHSTYNGVGTSYRFVVKDAPAFRNEPLITTPSDYISHIDFELSGISVKGEIEKKYSQTWENVDETLNSVPWFGGELRKSGYLKDVRDNIKTTATDPEKRMLLAYDFVKDYMKWNGDYALGSSGGVKKSFDAKKGTAGEVNIMLTTLLRELGLDANPVVLSTRSNGRISTEFALMDRFNYVICHVKMGEKEYLLDATNPYAKPGMLPEHALNEIGRLVPSKGTGRFLEIVPKDSRSRLDMIEAVVDPAEGTLKGTYNISMSGYEALSWRGKYAGETDDVYKKELRKSLSDWKIDTITIANKSEDLLGTVKIKCGFTIEPENASEDVIYLNPIMVNKWTENPLKSPERIYPLNMASGISQTVIANIKIPAGYKLEEIPKSEIISLPEKAGKFTYQVRQADNMIQVSSVIVVNKLQFAAEEYGDLKELFERVVQKHAQTLVIKKVN
ncbi:hypothetical protein DYBT9275_00139 [Dyadobacter sp. CECT 9275]|uniref:DUF3857 domain-containing protein n=2 Tax=Dyadobacter helix TaxID=2822344 RepID=A0A916NJC9_9BACT|nr:hypothetical protein DYBT9275_00139 [Dyadobacter sp. CECT 9275]